MQVWVEECEAVWLHQRVTCREGGSRADARAEYAVRMEWRHRRHMDKQGGGQGSGEGELGGWGVSGKAARRKARKHPALYHLPEEQYSLPQP